MSLPHEPRSLLERCARRVAAHLTPSAGVLGGVAAAAAVFAGGAHRLSADVLGLLAWIAGASAYLAVAWLIVAGLDSPATAARAARRDRFRPSSFWVVLLASTASAFAGATMLHRGLAGTYAQDWHFTLAVVAIASAWIVLHTDFGFRYAARYYAPGRRDAAPLAFRAHSPPDYLDFMLLSFLVGITTGASDVEVRARDMRWLAMLHNVVAFVFNLLILSICVNVLTSSLQR